MRALLILALALVSLGASPAPTPARPAVRQALVADCRLWLLDSHGRLSSEPVCDKGAGKTVGERGGHAILGIARDQEELWFAAAWYAHVSTPIRIRSLGGQSLPEFELRLPERLIGFTVHGGEATVLTSERVMTFVPGDTDWTARPLSRPLFERGVYVVATPLNDTHDLYVGRDNGEFGRGLHRIDTRTGATTSLPADLALCGWDRRQLCAPGGLVIADPLHRGCVIVSAVSDLLRQCVDRPPQLITLPREPATATDRLVITNGDGIQGLAAGDGAVFVSTFNGVFRVDGEVATPAAALPGVLKVVRDPQASDWPPMLVSLRS